MKPDKELVNEEAASASFSRPKVVTQFRAGYVPPFDVVKAVERMLDSLPPKYLNGLNEIVLTNTADLPRRLRRKVTKSRGRKVKFVDARGLYHQALHRESAWIEIFLNNVFYWQEGWFRWCLKIPLLRNSGLAGVLFHEIGHHIHATIQPEFRDKEDVADVWKVRLFRIYNRSRPFWVNVLLFPLFIHFRIWGKKRDRSLFQKGLMSRAEFDERMKKN